MFGQQFAGEKPHVDQPHRSNDNAHFSQLKHSETPEPGVNDHAVNHQVRTGSYEGADSAKDGGVGKRDKQFGGGHSVLLGPAFEHRSENDDDRRIVEEG